MVASYNIFDWATAKIISIEENLMNKIMPKKIYLFLLAFFFIIPAYAEESLDTLTVPAFGPKDTGASVNSSIALESGSGYKIVVSGTYQFKVGADWGYADAQYRMGAGKSYNQPFNSIEFDGERVKANIDDVANHTYTFFKTGSGKKLRLSIYDTYTTGERGEYDDIANAEDYTLRLPIRVRQDNQPTPANTQNNKKWLSGFEVLLAIIGLLVLYLIGKR